MTRQRPPSANELTSSAVGGSRERQVRQGIVRPQRRSSEERPLPARSSPNVAHSFALSERCASMPRAGPTGNRSSTVPAWHQRMNETSRDPVRRPLHARFGSAAAPSDERRAPPSVISRSRPSDGPAGAPNGGTAANPPLRAAKPATDGGPPTSGRVGARRAADLRDLCLRRLGCVLRRLRGLLERGRRGTDRQLPRPALEASQQSLRGQVELDRGHRDEAIDERLEVGAGLREPRGGGPPNQ